MTFNFNRALLVCKKISRPVFAWFAAERCACVAHRNQGLPTASGIYALLLDDNTRTR